MSGSIELAPGWWETSCHRCGYAFATQKPTEIPTCPTCARELDETSEFDSDDPELQRRLGRAERATASKETP